jgi:hypothetical protein
MGFGGSAQAMITILKNNEKMRSQRSKRKAYGRSYTSVKLEFPNTATEIDLKKIEDRLQRENKQLRLKRMLVFGFVFSILMTLIIIYI